MHLVTAKNSTNMSRMFSKLLMLSQKLVDTLLSQKRELACSQYIFDLRVLHLSSHTGLMCVLLGHPLADPRSRSRHTTPISTETNKTPITPQGDCIGDMADVENALAASQRLKLSKELFC